MGNIRILPWIKLVASVAVLIAVVAVVFYINRSGDDGELDEYFLHDAKVMQEAGLPVYWLGTEFTIDNLVFRGPHVAGFGAEVEGLGIHTSYSLKSGNTRLDLVTYSRDAWELVKDRMMNPPLPGVARKTVTVGGREGELLFIPLGTRPLNVLRLVLDFGDVVVVAWTNSLTAPAAQGGLELNPFINNPDLLVQVMENLRPYPQ
jgi:hypothetical protein